MIPKSQIREQALADTQLAKDHRDDGTALNPSLFRGYWCQQTFSEKRMIVNILGFLGYIWLLMHNLLYYMSYNPSRMQKS